MTLGEFIEVAKAHPELFDCKLIVEHTPEDVKPSELSFYSEDNRVWIEAV